MHPAGTLPVSLLQAIVAQPLSSRVVEVIWGRVEQACGDTMSTDAVGALTQEPLRSCGLSWQKLAYLHNAVTYPREHDFSAEALHDIPDHELITQGSSIKEVGRWTVEMLLLFELNRPDVFPVQDRGIQKAMRRLYGMRSERTAFLSPIGFRCGSLVASPFAWDSLSLALVGKRGKGFRRNPLTQGLTLLRISLGFAARI